MKKVQLTLAVRHLLTDVTQNLESSVSLRLSKAILLSLISFRPDSYRDQTERFYILRHISY